MYRCDRCGGDFFEPDSKEVLENMDGENGWWRYTETFCPYCGSRDFEEATEGGEEDDDI